VVKQQGKRVAAAQFLQHTAKTGEARLYLADKARDAKEKEKAGHGPTASKAQAQASAKSPARAAAGQQQQQQQERAKASSEQGAVGGHHRGSRSSSTGGPKGGATGKK
jgi:hypothetical protein